MTIQVERRLRAFPADPPRHAVVPEPFPERVIIAETATGPNGRAICGAYIGDGPGIVQVEGRFLGRGAPEGFDPPGMGMARPLPWFLDRRVWRCLHVSRWGGVMWNPYWFFCSVAYTFRHKGLWAVVFTDEVEGRTLVDYYRAPIVFEPYANGRVGVSFGPRRKPDPRDLDQSNRQWEGRFCCLQDAVSAFAGERVADLALGCRLFDLPVPPRGPATPETLPERITALRELYRAVRAEAARWPGVEIDRMASASSFVAGAYLAARIPQPLLQRETR